jgi:hypothetical protein
VITNRKSRNGRQYNDMLNTTQKTKDWATRTPPQNRGERRKCNIAVSIK